MGYEAIADNYPLRGEQPELPLGLGKVVIVDQLEIDFADAN